MVNRRDFLKIAGGATGAFVTGCGGSAENAPPPNNPPPPTPPPPPPPNPSGSLNSIEHIIFSMQENRSFDHYFGKMPEYRRERNIPGANDIDGLPANASNPSRDDVNVKVFAHHIETPRHENLSPAWNESHRCWNRHDPTSPVAKMDGFVYTAANFSRGDRGDDRLCDFNGVRAMGYYDWRDIPYYYALGSQFAISDRMFASIPASTLVNRWYLMAASSFGRVGPPLRGCSRQLGAKTIFDVCESAGISWKIYVKGDFTYYAWFSGYNKHKGTSRIVNADQFLDDAASGKLPQVAMIESGVDTGLDEHPKNDIQEGARYMRQLFNAAMKGPAWPKTAMILTYDEPGGFFDHVPSPSTVKPDDIAPILQDVCINPETGEIETKNWTPGDFDRLGFRVPFVMVSPWVKPHYVSHQVADHTSILKFIEKRFNLPSLTRRDAAAHDLLDMFDFSKPALLTPPELPEQGTEGIEDFCRV
jgi:phospholipase C